MLVNDYAQGFDLVVAVAENAMVAPGIGFYRRHTRDPSCEPGLAVPLGALDHCLACLRGPRCSPLVLDRLDLPSSSSASRSWRGSGSSAAAAISTFGAPKALSTWVAGPHGARLVEPAGCHHRGPLGRAHQHLAGHSHGMPWPSIPGWVFPFIAWVTGEAFTARVLRTLSVFRALRLLRIVRVIQRLPMFRAAWPP